MVMLKGCALTAMLSGDGATTLFGDQDLTALAETGAQVARFDVTLGAYPSWDEAILGRYSDVVQRLAQAGLTIIGLLGPGIVAMAIQDEQNPQSWNFDNSENSASGSGGENSYIDSYVIAAGQIVAGLPAITRWEVWNEPNAWASHTGTQYSGHSFIYPSLYATLLRGAYAAIKAVQPGATVITGGLLGHNNQGVLSAENSGAGYLQRLYDALALGGPRAQPPCDAIGQHLYVDQGGPVDPAHLQQYLDDVHGVILANEGAAATRPVFITEAAWTTAPGAVTPEVQAANLAALYRVCRANPFVAATCWFELRDSPPGNLYYGVYNADWSPKPSFGTFFAA